jgi:hypothetical protein
LLPNPILKVLSTLTTHQVRYLLMGGQACVLYGAVEFSRDTDLSVPLVADNQERLSAALMDLRASCIAVPPFDWDYLKRGHALHFRCQHPDVNDLRIDVLAVMRGVAPFDELWERRTTTEMSDGLRIELMYLPDLVQAKKTQRDKDWPMIRRLVESHHAEHHLNPTPEQVQFWLRECRTPSLLAEIMKDHPDEAAAARQTRPLLSLASDGDLAPLSDALDAEEKRERDCDREYWAPLKKELEQLRHRRKIN